MSMSTRLIEKLRAVKAPKAGDLAYRISIRDEAGAPIGSLEAINASTIRDPLVAEALCRWRRMHMEHFFTSFDATPARTQRWLESTVVADPARVLFFICDADGRRVGNFGICNISDDDIELDNMLRGEPGGAPRLIHHSELALIRWIHEDLGIPSIHLRGILSGTERTIRHHERIGFVETERLPLRREATEDGFRYVHDPAAAPDMHQINCALDREAFYARHPWIAAGGGPVERVAEGAA